MKGRIFPRCILILNLCFGFAFGTVAAEEKAAADDRFARIDALLSGETPHQKCGTGDLLFLKEHRENARDDHLELLKTYAQRPALTDSYVSANGNFRIHYTLAGNDAVPTESTNPDGVPDFVYEAAIAAENSYDLLVNTYGFRPHNPDGGVDGQEFDIYFVDIAIYYGLTSSEFVDGKRSAYLEIENDFAGGFFTEGLDAVRVTVAHEYFHAVQFAYNYRNSREQFFFEMSAVWFEDDAYPEINDYLQYLPVVFRQLDRPLHFQDGWHEYGISIFFKYWVDTQGVASFQSMWEGYAEVAPITAIVNEVETKKASFADALAEFYTWCLYTRTRAVEGEFFDDAILYPDVGVRNSFTVLNDTTFADSTRALSGRFYDIETDASKNFSATTAAAFPGGFRLAGAPQDLSGDLGVSNIVVENAPYVLTVTENEGRVNLVVVNGNIPENPAGSANSLDHEVFNVGLSLREIELGGDGFQTIRPNPFNLRENSVVAISYNLPETADVTIAVVTEAGQRLVESLEGRKPAGPNQFVWDGNNAAGEQAPGGIYFVILQTDSGFNDATKLAVVR